MHQLTKTDFLQYLACPEELWLAKNIEGHSTTPSLSARHIMEQGNLIDGLAKTYFEDNFAAEIAENGYKLIFQEAFKTNEFLVRADILAVNSKSKSLIIYEVKATNSIKSEHIQDVVFQKMVIESTGYKVEHCYLIYLDKNYVLDDKLMLQELFVVEEISDQVEEAYQDVKVKAEEAFAYINGPEPTKRITVGCGNRLQCSFVEHHYTDLPSYSVYDISRIHVKKLETLVLDNILDIMEVPSDFKLSNKQREQVDIAQSNQVIIDQEAIAKEIETLEYPLYFLDYETFAYAVPFQKGHSPYQQLLFQYSLHVIESPGAEISHHEYLLNNKQEPVSQLLSSLRNNIDPNNGTVLVWNKSFEQNRNKECANLFPEYAGFLLSVNDRVYDLMDVFKKGFYLHPRFKGKTSLKSVLPVLCSDQSYETLTIQNGTEANIKWHHWTEGQFRGDENDLIKEALLAYCKLDTWAMVRIWQELEQINTSESAAS